MELYNSGGTPEQNLDSGWGPRQVPPVDSLGLENESTPA